MDIALEIAIIDGKLEGVKTLLKAGAKINGNKDASPLMLASEHGQTIIVKYLLKHGANYNVKGWEKDNLHSDISFQLTQITEISTLCKKANNPNHKYILDRILKTSVSSHYDEYKNLSLEQIKQKFSKFKKQLKQDLQNFTEIKALLEDYSSGKKIPINTHTIVEDEGYVSDFKFETEKPKTGSRLGDIPSSNSVFFSIQDLNQLSENQTSLGGDTKKLFDAKFEG
ncbi:ankyrin repeat domain-containing protein [Rickettsia hoogstraalii]|nr:ankyrin repeat domain-containing protein [Rickettsia hoogstraalii]